MQDQFPKFLDSPWIEIKSNRLTFRTEGSQQRALVEALERAIATVLAGLEPAKPTGAEITGIGGCGLRNRSHGNSGFSGGCTTAAAECKL